MAARALSDEGYDPGLTDRVGPPVSEKEATTELDKHREGGDDQIGQAEQAGLTNRVDPPVSEREATAKSDKWSRPDREGGGGLWLGWKIREEAGPKPFLGLKSNRVKENQF
jgi:hypothetical protein